jgi:hypothetical protein
MLPKRGPTCASSLECAADGWHSSSTGRMVLSREGRICKVLGRAKIRVSLKVTTYFVDTLLTTPWIGCAPKCVVAGPEYTRVTFE